MALGFIGGRVVFISGGGPFIRVGFQGAAPNNELTGGEFRAAKTATVWNTGKITTRGRTLSSFSVDKIQEEEKCKKFQKCQNLFRNFRHFFEGKELKCQKIKVKKYKNVRNFSMSFS